MAGAIDNLPPVHPGEILREELDALHLSAREFADHLGVPPNAITEILNGTRGISAEMAIRLGRALATSEQYWMNLQSLYEAKKKRQLIDYERLLRAYIEHVIDYEGVDFLPPRRGDLPDLSVDEREELSRIGKEISDREWAAKMEAHEEWKKRQG